MQEIIIIEKNYDDIKALLKKLNSQKFFLVCDAALQYLEINNFFGNIDIPYYSFSGFSANPLYESVVQGVKEYKDNNCDVILALGGGSCIDVAKCIKLFSSLDSSKNFLQQQYKKNDIKLIAIPTTAGTGSESTRFAVIYYNGEKQSIADESIIPDYAILIADLLVTLTVYQKKCTVLDALCQGIESFWSVNSNEESKEYSQNAIALLCENIDGYIAGKNNVNKHIMMGANFAGRAINISQTTAAHAMSYKLTSMFNLPHGHAVAICLPVLWEHMSENSNNVADKRGSAYVNEVFLEIAKLIGKNTVKEAIEWFKNMLGSMEITSPHFSKEDLEALAKSVNITRLKNNPIDLSCQILYSLYKKISSKREGIRGKIVDR